MHRDCTAGEVDVTVIVIVYNDAERLGNAVRSVTRQSLSSVEVLIVDDGSTDATPDVARNLQSEDERVRYVRRAANSGGCGAPRNLGIEQARGQNLMFLDSDDTYEIHACKNLLEALEQTDADFAMGVVVRRDMDTGSSARWFPKLFAERCVTGGLKENPGLIQDVLSVNKMYRRRFLEANELEFPEDVHYEDQIFSFRAYLHAKQIAVIPETVYYWRIYPSHERSSITRQRHEISNLRDRITVHRRLDEYIASRGDAAELAAIKDVKFLTDDLRLYLADMVTGDRSFSEQVLEEVQQYLRGIPRERFEGLAAPLRAAYGMALRRDVVGVSECMQMDRSNKLRGRVALHRGRWWWSRFDQQPGPHPGYPLEAIENTLLDVSGTRLVDAPLTSYVLPHELVAVAITDSGAELTVRTFDGLGRLAPGDGGWCLELVVHRRGADDVLRLGADVRSHTEGLIEWTVVLPLGVEMLAWDSRARWDLYVDLSNRGVERRAGLRWVAHGSPTAPLRSLAGRLLSERVRLYRSKAGDTAVLIEQRPELRGRLMRKISRRLLPVVDRALVTRARALEARARPRLVYPLMRRLPLRNNLAVFEAQLGTIFGDSPKYVYQELIRRRPDITSVWVLPEGHESPGAGCRVVTRDSYGYLWALARARYLVDNQTFPRYVAKRPGQRYLQTWHGIPLKRMGQDIGDPAVLEKEERGLDRGVGAWDHLVVPCPYFEEVFVPAFRFTGERVRYGTPRNDPLARGAIDAESVRLRLDIRAGKRVLLYAPTFRESNRDKRSPITLPFDAQALSEGLGPEWIILLRAHYLNRVHVPGAVRTSVLDVSDFEDVNDLYSVADVLVTDFSSSMFDFAVTRKPIAFYIHDYEEYVMSRGTYFDLRAEAPGPIVDSSQELAEVVQEMVDSAPTEAYVRFLKKYCGWEDGGASARAVTALLGQPVGGPSQTRAVPTGDSK